MEMNAVFDWLPDSEDHLRELLDQGLLFERHNVDFKRELNHGKGANKEHARDMAQFAVDGGVLIIGVDDNDKTKPPQLTPVDLGGLAERLDQIAHSLIDEPLHVRTQTIDAPGQPDKGYILVIVPPSPSAPHMVDGKYYGRGDTTKHALSDAEVQRLHQLALRRQHDVEDLLEREIRLDPWPVELRRHAHLFGVAQPVAARRDLLQQVLNDPDGWHRFIESRIRSGIAGQPLRYGWWPDLPRLSDISRRARAWALSSSGISPGRKVVPAESIEPDRFQRQETHLLDLEIREDGGLRLFCGHASDTAGPLNNIECALEPLILGLTKRLVLTAATVAEATVYFGQWDFGLAVTGLRDAVSWLLMQRIGWERTPFSDEDYRETVRVTYERLVKDPDSIVEELTGQLNRALGGSAPIP
jgi:Putative DNA-binding domain